MAKSLVLFFSRKGTNYVSGEIKTLEKGNAARLAEYIQKAVGADVFEIETVKPYSKDYAACVEESRAELKANARPELKSYLESLDGYETVFVVGPNWCGVYPMPVYSQLERLDFSGKKVCYAVSHEGSGLGGVPQTMPGACKGAAFGEPLAVRGSNTENAEQTVAEWAKKAVAK